MQAEKQFVFPSEETARMAVKAVFVELEGGFEKRSKTGIKSNKNVVFLKVNAEDETALKASVFTFTRLLELCKEVAEVEQ